jgi:large subunit ribosomal protein L25
VLRDLQRHPWKATIVHVDFQRVLEDEPIRMLVPLHFLNQETAPGVKTEGGMVSHLRNELLIECLPKDLPEHIEVDIGALHLNQSLKMSDIRLPAGVASVDLQQGRDAAVVSVHGLRAEEEAPAAAAAEAAPSAAAPAGAAKKPEAKKEEPKKDAGKK